MAFRNSCLQTRKPEISKGMGKKKQETVSPAAIHQNYFLILFLVLVAVMSLYKINGEDDIFWHIETGRYIVQNMTIPSADVFGFVTQGQQWIPFEWLWDVTAFSAYSAAGFSGLYIFNSILLILIFYLLFTVLDSLKIRYPLNLFLLLIVFAGVFYRTGIKPQMLSYLFLVLTLKLISDYKYFSGNAVKLFLLVPVFMLWANVHMGVTMGIVLLLAFITDIFLSVFIFKKTEEYLKSSRAAVLAAVTALFSVLVNPFGYSTFVYAYNHTKMKMLEVVYEWMSPFNENFAGRFSTIIFVVFLILSLFTLAKSFRKKDYFIVISIIITGYYGVTTLRFTVDYIYVSFIFFILMHKEYLTGLQNKKLLNKHNNALQYGLGIIFLLLILFSFNGTSYRVFGFSREFGTGVYEGTFPVKMYNFMKQNNIAETGERPFQTFEYGGYFLSNFPGKKNFIDSRNLNDEIWNSFLTVFNKKEGYQKLIKDFDFDYFIIFRPTLPSVSQELETTVISYLSKNENEWKLVYWDEQSLLFVKNDIKFIEITGKFAYRYITPYNIMYRADLLRNAINKDRETVYKEFERLKSEGVNNFFMYRFGTMFGNVIK